MLPKISVIFPVGNREAYLKEAIESVLHQTFTEFEFLIITDGVNDTIFDIVNSYRDNRINVIRFPLNLGVNAARNAGLSNARAPYIALMDSDDVALENRFTRQYSFMEEHPEITVCSSNSIKIFENGNPKPMVWPESDSLIKARLLLVDTAILNPTAMLRTEFIKKHSLRYDANFPRDHDNRFYVEMLRKGAIFYGIQEELLLYRRHAENITNDQTGVDEEKSRVREILFPVFFPELTNEEVKILLKGFHQNLHISVDEAFLCIACFYKAMKEHRSLVGEDRTEVIKILGFYLNRLKASLLDRQPNQESGS